MNRLWVRLWFGIMAAFVGFVVSFEVAEVVRVASRARTAPRGPVHATDELPELLPHADVVIVATPLTAATRAGLRDLSVRLDLIGIAPGRLPRHIPDAWPEDSGAH